MPPTPATDFPWNVFWIHDASNPLIEKNVAGDPPGIRRPHELNDGVRVALDRAEHVRCRRKLPYQREARATEVCCGLAKRTAERTAG
jgi:hypothetical protein